ncbi:MAG TPA: cytochrome c [Usitatibacter sp.]|jgi:cytochrome c5|nr:cytochrome c [Usitatibacter sp.]
MRHASACLLAVMVACVGSGCAMPRAEAIAYDVPHAAPNAAPRGAELYGQYCTGCHAGAARTGLARSGAPWLMHIQARVGMGTMPSGLSDTIAAEDAREIVDYLDAARAARRDD